MVLGLILLVNALFVATISAGVIPAHFYSYGRFLLLAVVLALLVGFFRGPSAVSGLVRPMSVWRVAPSWYLLAAAWPPLMCCVVLVLKSLAIRGNALHLDLSVFSNPAGLAMVVVGSFVGEIVWVSYAINRLSGRFTVLEASLIVGAFWTLWWMPIVVMGVSVIPGLSFSVLLVNMLGIATMCGFVYAHTRSGLVVLTLQVTLNLMLLVFPVAPYSGGAKTFWLFALVYLLSAVALHVFFGPRPLLSLRKGVIKGEARSVCEPTE